MKFGPKVTVSLVDKYLFLDKFSSDEFINSPPYADKNLTKTEPSRFSTSYQQIKRKRQHTKRDINIKISKK
ncbi:MAG: hypothetical protein V1833_04775 [Elusimicrobiota bacterium]